MNIPLEENPEYNHMASQIQIILKSSCIGRAKDPNGQYNAQWGLLDWVAKESETLFPDDTILLDNYNLLKDNNLRKEWGEYLNGVLDCFFPPYKHKFVIRKSGLVDGKDEWLIFPHPEDAESMNLIDSNNRIPAIRIALEEWKYESDILKRCALVGFGFTTIPNTAIQKEDGILYAQIFFTQDTSWRNRQECPVGLRTFILSLPNVRKATANRLKSWIEYIEWEKEKGKEKEWGALVIDIIEPNSGQIDWKYRIRISKAHKKRLDQSLKSMLYAVPKEYSENEIEWKRKTEEDMSNVKKNKYEHENEIGKLKKIRKEKENEKSVEFLITVEPPDPDEPHNVPHLEPFDFFILNSIARDLTQIERQEKAIKRLQNQESAFNNLHEWIFDITKAEPNPRILPELKYSLLPGTRLNDKQVIAVRKALNAKDVCLIQGPPGTGKTTVIAEIINQATLDGKKILLASQTNLAVDNALGRLGNVPNVRPIRRHVKSASQDIEAEKFIENNVVRQFFVPSIRKHCMATQIRDDAILKTYESCKTAKIELVQIEERWHELSEREVEMQKTKNKLLRELDGLEKNKRELTERLEILEQVSLAQRNNTLLDLPNQMFLAIDMDIEKINQLRDLAENEAILPLIERVMELSNLSSDYFD